MAKVNLAMLAAGVIDLKSVSEHDFSVAIRVYAEQRGWECQYFRRTASQGRDGQWRAIAPAGWPDLFLWRDSRAIAAELKTERGTASAEQKAKIKTLGLIAGVSAHIWKPRDAAEIIGALQ